MNSYNFYESKDENPQFIFLEKVKAMFVTIIEKERITNNLKISLSNSPNSNLMNFFQNIDIKDKGYIDVNDLELYLKKYSISFNQQVIRRFIHQYDKHEKFHLIYEDFCRIFHPYNQYNKNKKNNDLNELDMFLDILIGSFELIEQINEMTNDIRRTNNYTSYEAFMGITKGNKYLDEEFMNHFLDHNYNSDEIRNLIYLMDLNDDSVVSYEEFQDFFIPLIKYTEEIDIANKYDYNENGINKYDLNDSDNNFENNYKDNSDIVNYEKSGKFKGNNTIRGREEKEGKTKTYEKKYFHTFGQESTNNIPKNDFNIKSYNNYKKHNDNNIDKNFNSMNNLNYNNRNKCTNCAVNKNKLKYSEDENNISDSNNYNYIDNDLDNDNENDNENQNENENENEIDNECDDYCNFYKKTKKLLSPIKKSNGTASHETTQNTLQKTPVFNVKNTKDSKLVINRKNITVEESNYNDINLDKEYLLKKYGIEDRNNTYKNIKKDNDYILNIIDDNTNNFKESKKNDKYNVNHTEVQFVRENKLKKDLKNEKKYNINLLDNNKDKDKDNDSGKYNYNSTKKEENMININNFTCGARTESEKENSSIKKMNISNNDDNENDLYNLSKENNKISKNINISESHHSQNNNNNKNNNDNEDNNMILESFSEKINRETLNKKLKEYNNTSLINFIKYIQYLVKNEKKTIGNKDKLCLREDITLKELFCIFDYNKKNNISKKEFKSVCKKIFGLYPTSDQIVLVFKRYDKNKDDNLNLREFLGMIKPLKEEYASFLFNKKKNGNKNEGYQQLSMKSKKLLVDVVRGVIEDEGNYYKFKDDMINQNLFELNELWDNINKYSNNNKGLDKLDMNKLLMDNGCSLSQYDLDVLFNKMDYDDDQIISYEDLTQEFVNYY